MAKSKKEAVHDAVPTPEPEAGRPGPDESSIALLAYHLWLARGCPHGSDQEDWFLAESMLKDGSKLE